MTTLPWASSAFWEPLGHIVLVLAAILALSRVGARLARLLRQPAVILEITIGLAVGPVIVAVAGRDALTAVMPADVVSWTRTVGQAGLVLFLIGVAHELRMSPVGVRDRTVGWVTAGALVVPLVAGGVLVFWVFTSDDPALRTPASPVASALLIMSALTVTALPVLARILADRGLTTTRAARLSMSAAVGIDVITWLLVAIAIGLSAGRAGAVTRLVLVVVAAVVVLIVLRRTLRAGPVLGFCARFPRITMALTAAGGIAAARTVQSQGLPDFVGAMLLGFALPGEAWQTVVDSLTKIGTGLAPVFFVVTGITVLTTETGPAPWVPIALVTALGIAGKVGGGWLGARLGHEPGAQALRVGVLMNTRGLTELVVLQAGLSAGLLAPKLFLAFVIMALVTTAMTSPAYMLIDLIERRKVAGQEYRPAVGSEPAETNFQP